MGRIRTDPRYKTTLWKRTRLAVLARDGYRCQIQGDRCEGTAPMRGGHVDHIISPVDGGEFFARGNLRAACPPCNQSRGKGTGRATAYPQPSRNW